MLYSLLQINQSSPYKVLEYEENTACFITDSGVVYMVGFIAESNLNIPNAYRLFITPKGRFKHVGTDAKIGQTIAEIIKSFFRNSNDILIYVCDTSDRMQAVRNRKFKIWFRQYTEEGDFYFVSEKIDIGEDEYFAAMIINKLHHSPNETIRTFHQYFHNLREKLE